MTRRLGILGFPLGHSVSPAMHQAALDHHGLDITYTAWPTPPNDLVEAVARLRGDAYLGANVTIPHKERVRELMDDLDESAGVVGAVNTIVRVGSRLVGHNTDALGLVSSLRDRAGFDPAGRSVLLLGAGGAARAAAFGLATEGIGSLVIANRTLARAQALAADVADLVRDVRAVPREREALAEAAGVTDLIVNATSVGMSHGPAEGLSPLEGEMIPRAALVCDMVYVPQETPLLRAAQRAGARSMGGLSMLVYQGAEAFRLWTGRDPPIGLMFAAATDALSSSNGPSREAVPG